MRSKLVLIAGDMDQGLWTTLIPPPHPLPLCPAVRMLVLLFYVGRESRKRTLYVESCRRGQTGSQGLRHLRVGEWIGTVRAWLQEGSWRGEGGKVPC